MLIHAAVGGAGTTAIQLAKILGAGLVIGTVGSEHKIVCCRSALGFSLGTTRSMRPYLLRDTADQVLPYLADGH